MGGRGVFNYFVKSYIFGGAPRKRVYTSRKVAKMFGHCMDGYQMVLSKKTGGKKEARPAGSLGNTVNGYNGYTTVTQWLQMGYRRVIKWLQKGYKAILGIYRRLQYLQPGYITVANRFYEELVGYKAVTN